ncbi:MAG: DUF5063 domain-containing protein [Alloprevotella sp.]|nr:DUF5063 domain-containing protein [Alloprevotella sp.]
MKTNEASSLYAKPVIEFVTVAAEFCKLMESAATIGVSNFAKQTSILLSMLYLKVQFISAEDDSDGYNEEYVTEDDYNHIRSTVASLLGANDEYLTTAVDDFKYSDQPILHTISEDLADLYQVMRNLLEVFRNGYEDAVQKALFDLLEQYRYYWGRVLLNAQLALHLVVTQDEPVD